MPDIYLRHCSLSGGGGSGGGGIVAMDEVAKLYYIYWNYIR